MCRKDEQLLKDGSTMLNLSRVPAAQPPNGRPQSRVTHALSFLAFMDDNYTGHNIHP